MSGKRNFVYTDFREEKAPARRVQCETAEMIL